MKFCIKCKGTGKILEKRASDYLNSFDYYPVSCPHCQEESQTNSKKVLNSSR
ncbi:hypothetical protein [Geminocystis sp. GBBB08]|uniref:hypothetical protein n=1 Tax=Geminocystis sp. GBBB08 TaxID=2604140 RepID=UPI0027E29856|nr:hypothetical protein [Geminocystis sp. GBBB08]